MSGLDRFDLSPEPWAWPMPLGSLRSVGQSVLADRDGSGRPHYGIDLFAPALAVDSPPLMLPNAFWMLLNVHAKGWSFRGGSIL